VNQTGAGNTRVLAESVPSNPGLKNSVNICGETTSISLADAELLGESSVTGAGVAAVVDGMDALEGATVFVSTEFGAVAAISGEFVGAGRSTSMGGSANDVAMAAEKRSGGGPICFKYALFPRICGAAHKASITAITVSLRIFNSPMTSPCFIGLRQRCSAALSIQASRCGASSASCRQILPRLEENICTKGRSRREEGLIFFRREDGDRQDACPTIKGAVPGFIFRFKFFGQTPIKRKPDADVRRFSL
jgi:hypothetical protein